MTDKRALTYLYIQGGKEKLFSYLENAFQKKKPAKSSIFKPQPQLIQNQFSIFNFVDSKIVKKPKHFFYQELIDCLQGKRLEQKLGKTQKQPQIGTFQTQIQKFKLLHKKIVQKRYLKPQKQIISTRQVKQALTIKQSLSFFSNVFQDQEIDLQIKNNAQHINSLKQKRKRIHQRSQQIRFLLFNFTDKVKISVQMAELRQKYLNSVKLAKPKLEYKAETVSNKVNAFISDFLQNFFSKFLQSIKLNEVFKANKIHKSWDASGLLKEEVDVISKKITGKMLYSVEQDSNKIKKQLKKKNVQRQYYIRQKKQNFHNNDNSKPGRMIQFDCQGNYPRKNEQPEAPKPRNSSTINYRRLPSEKIRNFQNQQIEFDKPKSKTQFIRKQQYDRKASLNQNCQNKSQNNFQIYYVSNISQLKSLPKKMPSTSSHIYQAEKPKNKHPLNINSFDQFAYNPNSHNPNSQNSRNNLNKPTVNTTYTNLKLFKYPIKIESFQVFSARNSTLCYHIQEYSLKELPLKFIKDRIKFKQNKVKIQYPYNFNTEQQVKVAKSLQILSCLGAEVSCQVETSYKYWNQIDEVQIMSVSWLLEMPLRDVLQCYANFFCANQTKK